ncbi:MAG: MFS transporter [Lentisphaeria bacterium]|nr:MFS transporter [Lentisphaeria bacterium]
MNFKKTELRPDQINETGQVTDPAVLKRDRIKFGVAGIMYQSEEVGLGPIHTLVVRLLGGGDIALGLIAGAGSASSFVQWIGAILLRRTGSNRRAMCWALAGGVFFGFILFLSLMTKALKPEWALAALTLYIIGAYGLAGASGVQNNVESSWIGDLVPANRLGSFTGVKWIIGSIGMLGFTLIFGQLAELWPTAGPLSWMFLFVAISHVVAIVLICTITDRVPQTAKFVASDAGERINYRNLSLWCYIWFYVAWAGGRTALLAFTTAYMMDCFGFGMGKIALLFSLQAVVNLIMLFIVGKLSDRIGSRKPLMAISGFIALAMLLWPASAWFGIGALIVYQVLNGAAGSTHNMLAINYSLEIFPAKGRAAYIAFSRAFIGAAALVASVAAGVIMKFIGEWQMTLCGVTLNRYHLFFLGCTLFTASCIIPLFIARPASEQKSA